MTRRIYTYLPETGWGPMNMLATIGAFTLGLGAVVFVFNLLRSRRHGAPAGPNPWNAGTLEWSTTSPPPRYNFNHLPSCEGREPVWENRPDAPVVVKLDTDKRDTLCTTLLDAVPHHRYEMSADSWWPLVVAIGTAITFIGGAIFHPAGVLVGAGVIALGLVGWFWVSAWRSLAIHRPGMRRPKTD